MNDLIKRFNFDSEGKSLNVYRNNDRPCVLAYALGALLGYADKGLQKLIRNNPSQFKKGYDYDVLEGHKLSLFKKLMELVPSEGTSLKQAPAIMILYETGIHKVLLLTEKPIGVEVRNKLGEEVMPQLTRDNHYSPERTVDETGQLTGDESLEFYEARTRRLAIIEKYKLEHAKLEIKRMTEARLRDKEDRLAGKARGSHPTGYITPTMAVGDDLKGLTSPNGRDITSSDFGKTAGKLGYKGDDEKGKPGYSFAYVDEEGYDRWKYSPAAVEGIKYALIGQGWRFRTYPGQPELKLV